MVAGIGKLAKEKCFYQKYRKELLKKGLKECPECGFVEQWKGQKEPHFYTCSVVQERMRRNFNPSKRSC